MRNERRAWMSCPACRRPPENPYSDTRVAELVASVLPSGKALPWSAVEAAWRRATLLKDGVCGSELILVSVVTGADGSPPSVHAAACLNASLGVLWRYKEFKFYLQLALHGLASGGARPPESFAFVLDLTDRGDGGYGGGGPWVRDDGRFTKHVLLAPDGTRLPKLASSGPPGCAANLPVPFGLKGFGAGSWQAILRSPNFGGGSNFHFPRRPPPSELSQQAVWRGALRDYSGPCVNASAEHPRLRVVQMADRQGMRRTEWRGGSGGAMLRLNASFMPCATNEGGPKCSREALKARGLQLGSRVSFEAHVKSVAAMCARAGARTTTGPVPVAQHACCSRVGHHLGTESWTATAIRPLSPRSWLWGSALFRRPLASPRGSRTFCSPTSISSAPKWPPFPMRSDGWRSSQLKPSASRPVGSAVRAPCFTHLTRRATWRAC